MTGTGTQTRTTGVTTIALLVLRTGELKNRKLSAKILLSTLRLSVKKVLYIYVTRVHKVKIKLFAHCLFHLEKAAPNRKQHVEYPHHMFSWRNKENIYMDTIFTLSSLTP